MNECVCLYERARDEACRARENQKVKGPCLVASGVRKQDNSTLTSKAALLPSSYRTERGSCPPGKGINQDLREPRPDKTKSVKIKIKAQQSQNKDDAQNESKTKNIRTKVCEQHERRNSKENAAEKLLSFPSKDLG